ncbi:GH36-type glycosyl hydrolase domain-containing protein [Alkalibacterium thalassium]|uniref:Putative lysine transport system substrate-binding protein n=1 Tax=Alkalibacterium thalassium TaxID=426701 RepID=A0A1G9C8F6_9LACT|nr:cellobiose phosphorylase [Alkalibacterium thalassium]SDK47942.1 putative lysine transport system substrate-binding protein [Alkalibacterium thalassium]
MKKLEQSAEQMTTLTSGNTEAVFLQSGDLYKFSHQDIMINQVESNMIDGSLNNLYLRTYDQDGTIKSYTPLLGIRSKSTFSAGQSQATWTGTAEEIEYTVRFSLAEESVWFWEVELSGAQQTVDVIYGQDLGLAGEAALKANEAYVAQYVDHKIIESDLGYSISSRQNQPQDGKHPYLQEGSLTGADGFLTDGFQFFGTEYKETSIPKALLNAELDNKNKQYEFAYSVLKSKKVNLEGQTNIVFYQYYQPSHPEAVEKIEGIDQIQTAYQQLAKETVQPVEPVKKNPIFGQSLSTAAYSKAELDELYPSRIQEEKMDGELLSFFTDQKAHVALKEKEVRLERPHGQILFTHNHTVPDESIMSTTSWMYGIFNAQLVMGNTDMNKALSNARNAVNYFKTSGQRVYVWINEQYHLLALPSLMEIGINYVKWLYKTADETFIVTNLSSSNESAIQLSVESTSGQPYEYLVTNQMTLNSREYQTPIWFEEKADGVYFTLDEHTAAHEKLPDLTYRFSIKEADYTVVGEEIFLEGAGEGTANLVNFKIAETERLELLMQGSLKGESFPDVKLTFAEEVIAFHQFFKTMSNGLEWSGPDEVEKLSEKMNLTTWWYTHNMLVHYLVPHGLEQFGGAAWGTRDVSQGPSEYLLAMQKYDSLKEVIKRVYGHQHVQDGNWPQWFMFDSYTHLQADESHGDVIVWPLKMLSDYIEATNDVSILDVEVHYFDKTTKERTAQTASIRDHVQKQIDYIQSHFLWDTFLSSYGDGDWDDTLQPHDQSLKKYMASSWTIALTYQTLTKFAQVLKKQEDKWSETIKTLAEKIHSDFDCYISSNEVVPGFVYMPSEKEVEKMIHPDDQTTGIQYRLLPMIRGMISELFSKEQALAHYEVIQKHLNTPDGVRLMNRPATYRGGVSHQFKRAEQAANFGREIGLMYVHAHIRYIEAMAKIGKADEVWKGFETINPINLPEVVENAEIRQSNTYFSSSDADFSDRYEAQKNFDLVKKGEVKVKGGWRIYSSGPGIYLNQLIASGLGIRVQGKSLVLDPVLTKEMDGLQIQYRFNGHPLTIHYLYTEEEQLRVTINGSTVDQETISNPYRNAGVRIAPAALEQSLDDSETVIEVRYPVYG